MTINERGPNAKRGIDDSLISRITAANAAWTDSSRQQMMALVDQISKENENIQRIVGYDSSVPVKAGFVAEELHAGSFNLQSILQGKTLRALTDRYEQWSEHGLRGNDPTADIVVVNGDHIVHKTQLKYYQDSHSTANAMRETRDGTPYYKEADAFVGPSDQVNPTDGSPSIADVAHQTSAKNVDARPEVSEAASLVEDRVTDRVDVDGTTTSRPISKLEAQQVAKDNQDGKDLVNGIHDTSMTQSTVQQMQRASASAAGIAAVMTGTLNTIQYLKLVRAGKITTGEAVRGIVINTSVAAADSALKAAAAAGAVSVFTRLSVDTLARSTVSSMAARSVGGAAICAVDAIECMVLVAAGKMTLAEMETRTGKNILQTAGGVWGSSIGISVASSLGATAGLATVLAGMAGGLVVGVAVTIAIENHIEKPYREIMANTAALSVVGKVMCDTAEAMEYGQKVFAGFLAMDKAVDAATADQLMKNDYAGSLMRQSISRL